MVLLKVHGWPAGGFFGVIPLQKAVMIQFRRKTRKRAAGADAKEVMFWMVW